MRNRMLALVATVGLILTTAATGCAKRTIAKVNGEDITEQQLVDELEAQQGRDMLDYLITKTLIQQEARTKKVSVSEAEAKEYVDHIAKQMEDQGQKFSDFLEQRGMTRQDVEQRYRDFYLLLGKLLMTPEELKKDFEDNRNRFDVPAEVNYSRIIVKTKDDADKVRKQLEGGDKSFADLAKEVSIDEATKDKGGVWASPVQQGRSFLDPELEKFLFDEKIKPGDLSEPIQSRYPEGYMIAKLDSRKPGKKVTYDEVKWDVWDDLLRSKSMGGQGQEPAAKALIDKLKKDARLQILDKRYEGLLKQYKEPEKPPQSPPPPPPPPSNP